MLLSSSLDCCFVSVRSHARAHTPTLPTLLPFRPQQPAHRPATAARPHDSFALISQSLPIDGPAICAIKLPVTQSLRRDHPARHIAPHSLPKRQKRDELSFQIANGGKKARFVHRSWRGSNPHRSAPEEQGMPALTSRIRGAYKI